MLRASVLIETEVGKVAHVAQAIAKLDGVQLAEDLVGPTTSSRDSRHPTSTSSAAWWRLRSRFWTACAAP
jgi:hypothetical protein